MFFSRSAIQGALQKIKYKTTFEKRLNTKIKVTIQYNE